MAEGTLLKDGFGCPLTLSRRGGHELADASWIGMQAFCNAVAGQRAPGIQDDKGQDMNGVADLCGIFHESWPPLVTADKI